MSKYSTVRQGSQPANGRAGKQLLPLERLDSTVTKLCDLHVYKVPPDLWRENFNNILNNVVTETISIGIIRVPSETRLVDLRDEIIQQLQPDDMGPRDWVFLRSVGRSLTRLRSKQEYQLKAKHFLPPVSFAPELYILEATPEVRDALAISERGSSQSPPLSRRTSPSHRGYPNTYRNGYGGDLNQERNQRSAREHVSPGSRYQPLPQIDPSSPDPAHRQARDKSAHSLAHSSHAPKPYDPHGSAHPGQSQHLNPNKDKHSDNFREETPNKNRHGYRDPVLDDHSVPWAEREHRYVPDMPEAHPLNNQWQQQQQQYITRPEILPAVAAAASAADTVHAQGLRDSRHWHASPDKSGSRDYHRRPDDDSGVAEMSPDDDYNNSSRSRRHTNNYHSSRRDEYDMLTKRLDADRFALDDETEEERRRRLDDLNGMSRMDRQRWDADQDERRRQAEEDKRREDEERRRKEEDEKRRKEEEEEERRKKEEMLEEERRKRMEEEAEAIRREEERRQQAAQEEEDKLRDEMKSPVDDDPMTRDTESGRQRRRDEKMQLLKELEDARLARQEQEKEREELVKKAKALQHKTTNRRNDARDMWKKKYFEEKKKTAPLEENSNRLRQELEALHRRLMNTLEGPKEKNTRLIDTNPSQKNNYIIQCTKLQHDIEDLQRRVANAKMKLTAEMK
ncbi:spermatogenesis-associated protein 1, partial [Plakobranchus ocellatus]